MSSHNKETVFSSLFGSIVSMQAKVRRAAVGAAALREPLRRSRSRVREQWAKAPFRAWWRSGGDSGLRMSFLKSLPACGRGKALPAVGDCLKRLLLQLRGDGVKSARRTRESEESMAAISGGDGEAELRLIAGSLGGLDPVEFFALFRVGGFEKVVLDLSDGSDPLILDAGAVAGLRAAGRGSKLLENGKAALFVTGDTRSSVCFVDGGWSRVGRGGGFDLYVSSRTGDAVHVRQSLLAAGGED